MKYVVVGDMEDGVSDGNLDPLSTQRKAVAVVCIDTTGPGWNLQRNT
jgi:hypothetical protein